MKSILFLLSIAITLVACDSGTTTVAVGNKTTIEIEEVFNAGEVLKGEKIHAVFNMKNTGDYPLVVADIKGSCTCTVVDKPEEPIMPGDTYIIKADVDTDKTGSGAIVKNVSVVANTEPSPITVAIKAVVLQNK